MPNYDCSILSLSNSLLKYYGAANKHSSIGMVDEVLRKNYKNVVLIVFDGMGSSVLRENLSDSGFFLQHKITDISSVYPSTTTAALTSIESGLSPVEHGWLGWSCYFEEVGECVNLFNNGISRYANKVPASGEHLANRYMGYKSIFSLASEADKDLKTFHVSPFSEHFADSCDTMCEQIERICAGDGKKLIYGYTPQPDHDLHDYGCNHANIKTMLEGFDERISRMCQKLRNTVVFITADHGHTPIKMLCVEDFPEIYECLAKPLSIEPRCVSFFIKNEFLDVFADRFNKRFAGEFSLLSKSEFLSKKFLGNGTPHVKTMDFLGEYIAVATGGLALWYRNFKGEYNDFKAGHAGLTKNEMTVPLIVFESN